MSQATLPAQRRADRHMLSAETYVRALQGGGSQPQLVRADDGKLYAVKLMGNNQGTKILANEFVVGRMAKILNVPSPEVELIYVDETIVGQINSSFSTHFEPGIQFASTYVGTSNNSQPATSDIQSMSSSKNVSMWPSVVVLDTLTQNQDRSVSNVIITREGCSSDSSDNQIGYSTSMTFWAVDYGYCLGVTNPWSGLRSDHMVFTAPIYRELVTGNDPFGRTLELCEAVEKPQVESIAEECPCETWHIPTSERQHLVTYLSEALRRVSSVIKLAKSNFSNWKSNPSE